MLDPSSCEMEAFNALPFELQAEVLRRLPFADKLSLRLVNQQWNELARNGVELTLVWNARSQKRFLHSSTGYKRNPRKCIPSVAVLQQSQLAGRIYKLELTTNPYDDSALQTIRELGACFGEVLFRPLTLELRISSIGQSDFDTSLAQDGARFRLVKVALAEDDEEDDAAGQQQIARAVNYLLAAANHLQELSTTTSYLARLQRMPLGWNNRLTTLDLIIFDPVHGATCIQMVATGMRNLQAASFDVYAELLDKRFFNPLVCLPHLRWLAISSMADETQFRCELPSFAKPGLLSLQNLILQRTARLARDPHLFKQMPRLENLVVDLESECQETHVSLEDECREVMSVFIDNCHAASLPHLQKLRLRPYLGRSDGNAWLQSPTLDFDFAQMITAAAKCSKLETLCLSCNFYGGLSVDVLLPALEQCPIDYLLTSPREVQINGFRLDDLLNEPQCLLDYAIGMQRTGLQQLTIHVKGLFNDNDEKHAATQRVIQNTIRLLALDLPKLNPEDIQQKSTQANRWSESIVFFERDSGRRHELCLSTVPQDW